MAKQRKNSRNASGSGSIRQRSDGTWEARFSVGRDPGTGKRIRKSVYGKTQAEVRRKMNAAIHEVDTGVYQEPSKMTVKTWLNEWLQTYCTNTIRPLTLASYRSIIDHHIVPSVGAVKLQDVRGVHVQKMYNGMIDNKLSPKTVKNVSAVLHKAFDVAVKQGYIQSNPCDAAILPKATKKEIKPLTDSEIAQFLEAIKDEPFGNAYALCLFVGLREGECLGLSWKQIDFDAGTLVISQQLQKEKHEGAKYYIAPTTKSGKPRTIQPPAIAFEYLKAERRRQLENRMRNGAVWENPDDLVFTNEAGEHLAFSTFYKHFKQIAVQIGRPDARPHDLRHTAATVAIASGADIKSVQDLLGHATASFTLNVYAHTSEQMMKDTSDRVQNYYDNLKIKA